MSERSNVSIAEILGDNYYIDKLTSSDYSPSVGDTVTITLLVKDVFGDPVTGQTRTVTCTGGSFVSVNGTSITASSSVSVTTGSGGTVTLGLSVSVADNIIVSDGRADCREVCQGAAVRPIFLRYIPAPVRCPAKAPTAQWMAA